MNSSHRLWDKELQFPPGALHQQTKTLQFEAASYFLYPQWDLNLHLRQAVHLLNNSSEFCNLKKKKSLKYPIVILGEEYKVFHEPNVHTLDGEDKGFIK